MDFLRSLGSSKSVKDHVVIAEESGEEKEKADYLEREKGEEDADNHEDTDDDDEDEDDDDDEDDDEDLDDVLGEEKREWQDVRLKNARPPPPLTVTHVNQTLDLQRLQQSMSAVKAEDQTSSEWLETHSVEHLQLTLQDLVDRGKIGKLSPDQETGKVTQHIQFDAYDVNEFEYKLNMAIEMYTKRIKFLLQGSKRVFGHVKGERVAVCIDNSDANLGFGRQTALQENLIHLLDEQLLKRKGLYLMSFGTEVDPLWPVVRDVNERIVEEGKEFVMRFKKSGGSNLLKAMKHVMKLPDIDSVVILLGSLPDQPSELLCDYVTQLGVGRCIPFHTIAYDCSNALANITLRNLAEASGGRYHCYAASSEEQIYTGTDITLLLKAIHAAQDVINKIKDMRKGMMGSALISIMNEISTEVAKLPQSRFLPRPPGHDLPLRIDIPKFQPRGSVEWLKQHGLKAKRLDLYQVLAPNAYSYREEFIPVIKRAVQSQVHEKAMVQFAWHDGSMKNIHVDMTQLFEYQKQLKEAVQLYERRVDWLATGSRRIFGTLVEKNMVILVDNSVSNVNYLVHIQHSIRLLLEQQVANKDFFNIITFGGKAKAWKPTMVRPTTENLQEAWKWVLDIQCGGSRNFLSALRMTMENDEEQKHHVYVQGIYVFSSGVPDQDNDVVAAYAEEAASGWNATIHTILFNVDDYDEQGAIPGRYANITRTAECLRQLSHCTGGRFMWFRETGIIENDDIQLVNSEVERALNYSRKCSMLVEAVKKKYKNRFRYPEMEELRALPPSGASEYGRQRALLPPPPQYNNYGSSSRQYMHERHEPCPTDCRPRPSSAHASARETRIVPKAPSQTSRPSSAKDPMQCTRTSKKGNSQHFFLEGKKHETGAVFKDYPDQKSVRKGIHNPVLPEGEDSVPTKEWMRVYSLKKLKLDLNRLISGPDCKHMERNVKALRKQVSAKYCDIFPTINIKGTLKHLQLLPHELNEYEAQVERVLRRYLRRLQWLLSGSRRVFGTLTHKKVVLLVDTSGSMEPRLNELKKEMAALMWDQIYKLDIWFNIIQFSGSCKRWRDAIQSPSEENCHDAVRWSSNFHANGNTCTLEALQMAFEDKDIEAIYLLTDGKPDTSTSLVLREVARMNMDRNLPVNTISFNCSDSTANSFLHLLASETGGRYHRCPDDFNADIFAHKLLSEGFGDSEYPHLPQFEGDDLRRLGTEIGLARKHLQQAKVYKDMYRAKTTYPERPPSAKAQKAPPTPFVVGLSSRARVKVN
ncbi:von Willebrand factor A domain-containing protein 3A-like [Littorina saxatilis]|uniref:VWFA domain-containing protein n=1 Tax=Littorina saxatilis TaxID=31220 RepID=A0AAN9GLS4_9CAEN